MSSQESASHAPNQGDLQPQVLFARQPILDDSQNLVAYELLFRGDFSSVDGDQASARVFLNAFDAGLFRAQPDDPPMFVNFTRDLLFNVPPFDTESFVIELLEDIEPTPDVVQRVGELKEMGYRIALDDFVYSDAMIPLLHHADIVKVDVMDTDLAALPELVATLNQYDVTLLAEKVEDYDTFYQCKELGFTWYQGFFFARPESVEGKSVGPNQAAVLTMVAALQQPDIQHATLDDIISSDSGLTYKVLRLSNSAANRRAVAVNTVAQAISMLGIQRLQNFATLMTLSELGQKPPELQVYAKTRALMCERLGSLVGGDILPETCQAMGILSCCDAYFDLPLAELIPQLPVSEEVMAAILRHEGPLGAVLQLSKLLQEGRWGEIEWSQMSGVGLTEPSVIDVYQETTSWAESAADVELW